MDFCVGLSTTNNATADIFSIPFPFQSTRTKNAIPIPFFFFFVSFQIPFLLFIFPPFGARVSAEFATTRAMNLTLYRNVAFFFCISRSSFWFFFADFFLLLFHASYDNPTLSGECFMTAPPNAQRETLVRQIFSFSRTYYRKVASSTRFIAGCFVRHLICALPFRKPDR